MTTQHEIETLCEVMHDAYEKAATGAGWETQEASRVPWAEVPHANKETMRAAVRALLDHQQARRLDVGVALLEGINRLPKHRVRDVFCKHDVVRVGAVRDLVSKVTGVMAV